MKRYKDKVHAYYNYRWFLDNPRMRKKEDEIYLGVLELGWYENQEIYVISFVKSLSVTQCQKV
jgi:hypothetical protein